MAEQDEKKGLGSKFLGLFVEKSGEDKGDEAIEDAASREKTPAELVAELAGQAGVKRAPAQVEAPPSNLKLDKMTASGTAGPTDFDAIFRDAGMDVADLDRVKKAEELLKSLPESTPHEVKKQIVEASLKAFGFEIEKIVLAATNQKRALDAFVKVNEGATAKAITDAEAKIKGLEEQIANLRADITKRTGGLTAVSTSATARKEQVQRVLAFFAKPV